MKKILYFTAEWCGPCKMIKPKMQQLSQTLPVQFIDVDTNKSTCEQYGIRNVPCVVIIDNNGTVTGRLVGSNITPQSVTEMFNK
jgi:thioredoxin 1